MNSTPEYILLEIFDLYANYLRKSPVLLLYINKRWNALALATPTLWTRIVINVSDYTLPKLLYLRHRSPSLQRNITDQDRRLEPSPIQAYLAPSVPLYSSIGLPLEAEIRWGTEGGMVSEMSFAFYTLDLHSRSSDYGDCAIYEFRRGVLGQILAALNGSLSGNTHLNRVNALKIDLRHFSCPCHYLGSPGFPLGYLDFPSLRRLYFISATSYSTDPMLRAPILDQLILGDSYIELHQGMNSVKELCIYNTGTDQPRVKHAMYTPTMFHAPRWIDFSELQTLILSHSHLPPIPFSTHLPRLSKIVVTCPTTQQFVDSLFTSGRQFESLTLTETIVQVLEIFNAYPGFWVRKLWLNTWTIWDEEGKIFLAPQVIDMMTEVLKRLREREIEVEANDREMRDLLDRAQPNEL